MESAIPGVLGGPEDAREQTLPPKIVGAGRSVQGAC